MVEQRAVAGFGGLLRGPRLVLGTDIAHHAPIADEAPPAVVSRFTADQQLSR